MYIIKLVRTEKGTDILQGLNHSNSGESVPRSIVYKTFNRYEDRKKFGGFRIILRSYCVQQDCISAE